MSAERTALLACLAEAQRHVLAAVEGLGEDDLTRPVAPSGWSVARLLQHLSYDVEIFWLGAVAAGDEECVPLVRDGWAVPVTSGADAVADYRRRAARSHELLAGADLEAAPRWWPPAEVFGGAPFADVRACVLRALVETTTHAGHLDLVREQMDGHQHLVVG